MSTDVDPESEMRQLPSGGAVTTELLRSFLFAQLNHDVVGDQVLEMVVAEVRGGTANPDVLGDNLEALVSEISALAKSPDWRAVAEALVSEARTLLGEDADAAAGEPRAGGGAAEERP